MAPMSRHFSRDGVMIPDYVDYYRRRAEAEVGLIISECAGVPHPSALRQHGYPRFHGEDALAMWRAVIAAVHQAGGKMIPQIWHAGLTREVGVITDPGMTAPDPSGPSGLFIPLNGRGSEAAQIAPALRDSEIADIIAAFGKAAANAMLLGFDGIEIHGAHGYLIDQFFWSKTNRRSDGYGTSQNAAVRFAVEVVRECRRCTAPDFPLFFRWSQWKQQDYAASLVGNPQELEAFLTPLAQAGVDLFHCSLRRFWEPAFPGDEMTLSGWTRKLTGRPVCTVGSVGIDKMISDDDRGAAKGESYRAAPVRLDRLLQLFDRQEFDLVAIGRMLISDPDWVRKIRNNAFADVQQYSPDDLARLW